TFFPMHLLGLAGMPRRIAEYAQNPQWHTGNLIATIGAFGIAISTLPFIYNILHSMKHGEPAGNDPWEANSLEWWTTSPPPAYNFASLPPIRSERPVLDMRLEAQAREKLAAESAALDPGPSPA
ncbi:MAG: cytochrome ubiquinol oxidase subunit I, partial [Actinomycetota bacterium]